MTSGRVLQPIQQCSYAPRVRSKVTDADARLRTHIDSRAPWGSHLSHANHHIVFEAEPEGRIDGLDSTGVSFAGHHIPAEVADGGDCAIECLFGRNVQYQWLDVSIRATLVAM